MVPEGHARKHKKGTGAGPRTGPGTSPATFLGPFGLLVGVPGPVLKQLPTPVSSSVAVSGLVSVPSPRGAPTALFPGPAQRDLGASRPVRTV